MADAYIAPLGEQLNAAALGLARELRRAGLRIELGEGSFRLKKSFEAANKTARRIVILGEDELKSGILTVKIFRHRHTTKVPRAELAAFLPIRTAGDRIAVEAGTYTAKYPGRLGDRRGSGDRLPG